MSESQNILLDNRGQTTLITFNRPDFYNAMNRQMKKDIIAAIRASNKDPYIRTIILTGAGKAFSAGQDLGDRQGLVDLGHTLMTEWNPLIYAIRQSEKPVIAAINGVSAGAGLSVALSCDFLISKPQAKFVSGFAQIGLAPDAGSGHILVHALGYQQALEFFMTGKPLFAEELLGKGLINAIDEDVLNKSLNFAEQINGLAPLSVKMIKRNLQYAQNHTREQTIERETYTQRFLGRSEDYAEGVKAFHEKRPAQFKGK